MKKTEIHIFRIVLWIVALSFSMNARAQETSDSIDTESDDFVTVSFLIGSPLKAIYSTFGHGTLRLQCPAYQLDFVFTFETDTNVSSFMTAVAGSADAKFVAVPIEEYIADARQLGRELRQYRINLTLDERKLLWQKLDEEMMAGAYRHFNFFYTNCVTTSIQELKQCLIGEQLVWGPAEFPSTLIDGDFCRYACRNSEWTEFVVMTFIGNAYDKYAEFESKIMPETLIDVMRKASFVNDSTGQARPVVSDPGTVVLKGTSDETDSFFSPTICFAFLLLVTLLITALQRWLGMKRLAKAYDLLLFGAQLAVFLLMIYMTFVSELFRNNWNWYFVAFVPVPLLLMFLTGKNNKQTKAWMIYSAVLMLFILATPLIGALDMPHQLITASLLVRSVNRAFTENNKEKE